MESVNEELVSVQGVIDKVDDSAVGDNVDDSVVGDNVQGLFDGLVIILGNDRSGLVYE